jgi:hypothetical protein
VKNNSLTNNIQFSILISMDVLASNAAFFLNGATNNLVSDGNGVATLSTTNAFHPGSALWTYQVDGADFTTLFNAPFTQTAPAGTSAQNQNGFGPMTGVPSSIGIRLDFDLSPGEQVELAGNFTYIPTPGALALLGLAGIAGRRRR